MVHSRHTFVTSWTTVALVLCSSLVSAETLQSGHHSLIHRPTLQNRPSVTLDSAASPSRLDQSSVSPSTPQSSFRHKLVKKPTVPPLTATQIP